jgi:hypothetical protein
MVSKVMFKEGLGVWLELPMWHPFLRLLVAEVNKVVFEVLVGSTHAYSK